MMFMSRGIRQRRDRRRVLSGFTLIEMLVALLILAIMSALGYSTYRSARIAAERARESLSRTREIEFGLRIMEQDFSQAVPRPIRDPLGSTRAPSLRAGLGKATLVDLTRAGWSNTAGMQRSTLQRVSYQLTGDKFQRSYQTVLDPTQNNTPVVQDLLTGVKTVTLNYLDGNQNWSNQWPPATLPTPESLWTRPVAVEIVIEFNDWGRVRRLVEIAG
ncbi:MAG: type II secretion system minor pseudopilin GspJ [Steroidobacteraceae bacterium]|jgi:general secretion pathway protein J